MSYAKDDIAIQGTSLQILQSSFLQAQGATQNGEEQVNKEAASEPVSTQLSQDKLAISDNAINQVSVKQKTIDDLQSGSSIIKTMQKGFSYEQQNLSDIVQKIKQTNVESLSSSDISDLNNYVNTKIDDINKYIDKLSFNGTNPLLSSDKDKIQVSKTDKQTVNLSDDKAGTSILGGKDSLNFSTPEEIKKYVDNLEKVINDIRKSQKNLSVKEIKIENDLNNLSGTGKTDSADGSSDVNITDTTNASSSTSSADSNITNTPQELVQDISAKIMKAPAQSVKIHIYNMNEGLLLAMLSMRVNG